MNEVMGFKTKSDEPFAFFYKVMVPPGCGPERQDIISWKIRFDNGDVISGVDSVPEMMVSGKGLDEWIAFCDDIVNIASEYRSFVK